MSRWWLLLVPLSLALALAGWVSWLDRPATTAADSGQATAERAPPTGPEFAAPLDARPATEARASLWGRVLHDGAPVEGARVVARGVTVSATVTDTQGGFALEVDAPAQLVLSAHAGGLATATYGPLSVIVGQRVPGLTLELLAAATLEGRVIDAHARTAIPGAQVRSAAGVVTTGAAGRFAIADLAAGASWLEASAPGYLPRLEWLSLEGARAFTGLEIALVHSAGIAGRVARAGVPVVGAAVWVERANDTGGVRPAVTVTDAQGRFKLEVAPGTVQVCAAPVGQGRVPGPLLQVLPGQTQTVELSVPEALDATGVVRRDGVPLEAAVLVAHDAQSHTPVASANSGAGGQFRFRGVAVGRYVIAVRSGTSGWEVGPFEQTGEGDAWAVNVSAGAALAGKVLPASAGVQVSWRAATWVGPPMATQTDAAGAFSFEGVPAEAVTVEAHGADGAAVAVARPGQFVQLTLSRAAIRVGVSAAGRPVTDFRVRAREVLSGVTREADALSPQGTHRLEVPPGTWEVWVSAPGFANDGAPTRVSVTAADVEAHFELSAGTRYRGQVRDAATQGAIEGATVRASRRAFGLFGGDDGVSTTTDGAGRFELGPVLPGSSLVISKPGYKRGDVWAWQLGRIGEGPVDVLLTPGSGDAPTGGEPYEGVGMQLFEQAGRVGIGWVFPGAPAEAAGVRRGDWLIAVDGAPAAPPLDAVVARIRGPAGSVVRLSLQRGNDRVEAAPRRASIRQ